MFDAGAKTTDRDLGEREFLTALKDLDGAYFDVGLFEGEDHPDSEYTIAQIGAVHEFGTKPGTVPKIPERSFLRSTADEKEDAYHRRMAKIANKVEAGSRNLVSLLTTVGELAASDVRKKITTLKTPKKADATLKREGKQFTNPLIWLGYMRNAVRSRIVVGGAEKMTPKGGK
jgi:hypothetical protein